MPTFTVHQAKTNLSKLIEQAEKGEEVIIARGDKPAVKLVPVPVPRSIRNVCSAPTRGLPRSRMRSSSPCPMTSWRRGRASIRPIRSRLSSARRKGRTSVAAAGVTPQVMRVLVDTHALLWWFDGDPQLSANARELFEGEPANIVVSAASAWEIATKARNGKLPTCSGDCVAIFRRRWSSRDFNCSRSLSRTAIAPAGWRARTTTRSTACSPRRR